MRGLLTLKDLSTEKILELIHYAIKLKKGFRISYPDKKVATLFFENSTRTQYSFQCALMNLGIKVVDFDTQLSSIAKGETLYDTVRTFEALGVDGVVIRHSKDEYFKELENIKIPIGAVIGSKLFATVGPSVSMDIIPIGVVEGDISNVFTEAGINQTKHTITMDISATVGVAVPLEEFEMEVNVSLPICESIIVGPTPSTYMNIDGSGLLSSALDTTNNNTK